LGFGTWSLKIENYMKYYHPKRPVKSFLDLQVYQKTLGLGVEVTKRVTEVAPEIEKTGNKSLVTAADIANNLVKTVLEIPKLIATAHSLRFGDSPRAVQALEETMLACNLAVVYLEQFRDLVNPTKNTSQDPAGRGPSEVKEIEHDFFEEQIKEYLRVRGMILRLQRSWIKFMGLKAKQI